MNLQPSVRFPRSSFSAAFSSGRWQVGSAGSGVSGRALNIENGAAVGQQRSELPSLDPPDFFVIGTDGEHRYFRRFAQPTQIVGIAVEQYPTDSGANAGPR